MISRTSSPAPRMAQSVTLGRLRTRGPYLARGIRAPHDGLAKESPRSLSTWTTSIGPTAISLSAMARTRTHNVMAAQWSPNGGSLGTTDLTAPGAQIFGANVFSPLVQRQRLPKAIYKRLQESLQEGHALDADLADAVASAMKEWAMEKGAT